MPGALWTARARAFRAGLALTAMSPHQRMSATLMPTAALVACAMVVLTRATAREAMAGRSASRAGAGRLGETSAKPRATLMLRAMEREGIFKNHSACMCAHIYMYMCMHVCICMRV
jgi:hypothetical protein